MSLKHTNNTNTLNDVLLSLHPHFDTGIADYKAIHKDENVSAKAIGGFLLFVVKIHIYRVALSMIARYAFFPSILVIVEPFSNFTW